MSSKIKIALVSVVMLGLVGTVQAAYPAYLWGNASGDWASTSTWSDGIVPSPIFIENEQWDIAIAGIGGVTINVTTDGQGTVDMYQGYHVGYNTLNIAADKSFLVTHTSQIGLGNNDDPNQGGSDATGVVNVYGSFYTEMLIVGANKYTTGILNVYDGGSVDVGGWGCLMGQGAAGTGTVNLKGGVMTLYPSGTGLVMTPQSQIDIEEGTLIVHDDAGDTQQMYVDQYIDDGLITGYGGAVELEMDVNSVSHIFQLTAPAPPMASNPNPADGQRQVLLNATLSWDGATTEHDVYFGTDAAAVASATPASPEFKSRQTETTYNPGGLAAGQGYYWRIDEVGGSNGWKGDVWRFLTERTESISLTKGLVLDRQFHTIPPEAHNTIEPSDVELIKYMGFTFAKVLVNPAPMISGSTINTTNMAYVDEIVDEFLYQGFPVVVCIHPEPAFKTTYLGNNPAGSFTDMLGFYGDFAGYLAARWGQNEVVFQLMTEPFGNYTDWNTMLPQMVQAVRATMPDNTLIIGGADSGRIAGLTAISQACIDAINDNNVYWGFTYWDEAGLLPFLFQGGGFGSYFPYLKEVPYPSSVSNNAADYILPEIPSGDYSAALAAVNAYCQQPWDMAKQSAVLQPLTDWNNAHGGNLKLFCYEMGSPLDPGQAVADGGVDPADRIQYIHDKRQALEDRTIGWAYWSYNETFTVLNYPLRVAFEKGVDKSQISAETLIALGLPCGCGCINDPPAGDITGDCYVNLHDFAVMAGSWFDCTEPNDINCDY